MTELHKYLTKACNMMPYHFRDKMIIYHDEKDKRYEADRNNNERITSIGYCYTERK